MAALRAVAWAAEGGARRRAGCFGRALSDDTWQYIGSQAIVQGTYETFSACARKHLGVPSPAAG
jgi:urocanate hydratase